MKTELKKVGIVFLACAFVYAGLEVIFRSATNWNGTILVKGLLAMMILGGISGVILGYINEVKLLRKLPFWLHCIIGAVIITGLEWITGRIINVGLGWNFWDYKHLILSTPDGQINFFFSLLWLALSPVAFWVDDAARRTYDIFGIEKIAMVESAKASIMASRAQRFSENCKRTWVERAKDPSSKLYPNQDLRDLMGPENKS